MSRIRKTTLQSHLVKVFSHDVSHHILLKFAGMTISIVFVFFYSLQLGVERRGVVTGLLTITMISALLASKTISLPIRTLRFEIASLEQLNKTVGLIVIYTTIAQVVISIIFASFTEYFNSNLFLIAFFLAQVQSIQYLLSDILFSLDGQRNAGKIDLLNVVFQLSFFLLILRTSFISVASSVFAAFFISSLLSIVPLYYLIRIKVKNVVHKRRHFELKVQIKKSFALVAFMTIHLHFERLLILFILGFSNFAKFTVCTAYLVALRTFGDAANRFFAKPQISETVSKLRYLLIFFIPFGLGVSLLWPYINLVRALLGEIWLLPVTFIVISALNESLRLVIHEKIVRRYRQNSSFGTFWRLMFLCVLTLSLVLLKFRNSTPYFLEVLLIVTTLNVVLYFGLNSKEVQEFE